MAAASSARDRVRCAFCGSGQHVLAECRMPGVAAFRAETVTGPPARLTTTPREVAPVVAARRWCGIDPGQDIGLCAVAVAGDGTHAHDVERGRLIGHAVARAPRRKGHSNAAAKCEMFARVHRLLTDWGITDVVVEEPSEVPTRAWVAASGQRVRGQSIGTVFWQGAHYGLCLAAARATASVVNVWSYPPNTPKRRAKVERDTGELVLGWMQGHAAVATPRTTTLTAMRALLVQLKQRPEHGVLPTLDELRADVSEHERMALGVLAYHLNRERGRT